MRKLAPFLPEIGCTGGFCSMSSFSQSIFTNMSCISMDGDLVVALRLFASGVAVPRIHTDETTSEDLQGEKRALPRRVPNVTS